MSQQTYPKFNEELKQQNSVNVKKGMSILYQLAAVLPEVPPSLGQVFGVNMTCAVVTGSPTLEQYQYGNLIDTFPVVMRFNLHGTNPPSSYGTKTTHRIANVKVVRESFAQVVNFSEIIICKVHRSSPERVRKLYMSRQQRQNSNNKTFILTEQIILATGVKRPTTGLLGLMLLSHVCKEIHAFGFVNPKHEVIDKLHNYNREHQLLLKWSLDLNATAKLLLYPLKDLLL